MCVFSSKQLKVEVVKKVILSFIYQIKFCTTKYNVLICYLSISYRLLYKLIIVATVSLLKIRAHCGKPDGNRLQKLFIQ